jgi:hypothetical protein
MGPEGPQGPKGGDSIVTNEHGTYAFGICESTQGHFLDVIPAEAETDPKFTAAVVEVFRFPSACGRMHLCVGVPKHCQHWRMPAKTADDEARAKAQWRAISTNTLLERIEALEWRLKRPSNVNLETTHPGLDRD